MINFMDNGKIILQFTVDLYIFVRTGEWKHWYNKVEEYDYPADSVPEFSSILVPNVDNVRTTFLMHTIAKQNKVNTSLL